jgi:hypothetical protein
MEWINDLTRKEQLKAERPARSPDRLKNTLKKSRRIDLEPVKLNETYGILQDSSQVS